MPQQLVVPNVAAIAAVDPGGISGVARGIFWPGKAQTMYEAVAQAAQVESWEEEGSVSDQAESIAGELDDWFSWAHIEQLVPLTSLYLVIEDFQLRQRHVDLRPVRVTEQIEARWSHHGVAIERQTPSDAMTYATNARLRSWNAWVKGSAHRQDAMRHLVLKVSRLMNGVPI